MNRELEKFATQADNIASIETQKPKDLQDPDKLRESIRLQEEATKARGLQISADDLALAAGPKSPEQFAAQERINKSVEDFGEGMKGLGKPLSRSRLEFLKWGKDLNGERQLAFQRQQRENEEAKKRAEEKRKAQEAEAAKENKPPQPPKPGEGAPKPAPPPPETQPKPPVSSTSPPQTSQTPVPADITNSISTGFSNFTNQISLFGQSISTFDRSVASFRDSVNNIKLSQNPTNQTTPSNSTNITNVVGNMNWTIPADISNQLNTLTTIKLDPASIARLDVFKTDFNKIVQSLANLNINIPAKIEMFGQHQVNVTIDAPALENMIPGIESMVASSVSSKMEQIWNQSGGELGPTPTMYG
jgi:hypothetical protein